VFPPNATRAPVRFGMWPMDKILNLHFFLRIFVFKKKWRISWRVGAVEWPVVLIEFEYTLFNACPLHVQDSQASRMARTSRGQNEMNTAWEREVRICVLCSVSFQSRRVCLRSIRGPSIVDMRTFFSCLHPFCLWTEVGLPQKKRGSFNIIFADWALDSKRLNSAIGRK
jgi:hypothetical protein